MLALRLAVVCLPGLFRLPSAFGLRQWMSLRPFAEGRLAQLLGCTLFSQMHADSPKVYLRTADASVGEVIEPAAIRDLPLNGRMLIDLVLTVPGAHLSHGAQAGDMNPLYWRPGQRSAVSIEGNRPNANYFLLDGVTNTDATFSTLNLRPSPDAVQEFKVQTGSYSTEMGGAGGGQVNIVTRSGTNQFHGTVYEFLPGEPAEYWPVEEGAKRTVYASVAFEQNLSQGSNALIIAGASSGSQEGAEFATNENLLGAFINRIKEGGGRLPYFDVLIRTTTIDGHAQEPAVVSFRTLKQ
jgi:TonB-dependent Receptor Plug Domain